MLTGEERRRELIRVLEQSSKAVSGTDLAKQFDVSRQVIVQDIALLRATNKKILSTNKGYILVRDDTKEKSKRIVCVLHKDSDILREFECIVDCGAKVLDVVVEHEIYGQVSADLLIQNRQDAISFVEQMKQCKSKALSCLTNGVHYHTIEADDEIMLDRAEASLKEAGFLVNE